LWVKWGGVFDMQGWWEGLGCVCLLLFLLELMAFS